MMTSSVRCTDLDAASFPVMSDPVDHTRNDNPGAAEIPELPIFLDMSVILDAYGPDLRGSLR
jgi:hypothetical protein